jgi:hypothetical protein
LHSAATVISQVAGSSVSILSVPHDIRSRKR